MCEVLKITDTVLIHPAIIYFHVIIHGGRIWLVQERFWSYPNMLSKKMLRQLVFTLHKQAM